MYLFLLIKLVYYLFIQQFIKQTDNLYYFCCCFLLSISSDGIFDFLQFVIIFSVSLFPQTVVHGCQLLEESKVRLDLPGVPHVLQGLGGGVAFLQHEVGAGNGGGPAVAHVARDEDHPAPHAEGVVDEVCALLKVL